MDDAVSRVEVAVREALAAGATASEIAILAVSALKSPTQEMVSAMALSSDRDGTRNRATEWNAAIDAALLSYATRFS